MVLPPCFGDSQGKTQDYGATCGRQKDAASARFELSDSSLFSCDGPLIEENNRCFLITGTEASGVMLMEGKEENSEGTLTVGALARLIFGAASVEEIAEEKGVKMSDRMKNELKKIVPLSRIFLNEVV